MLAYDKFLSQQFVPKKQKDKFMSKAQTIDWLTKPQALNSLSKCKVAMLILRYQEGNDIEQTTMHDKPKHD